MSDPVVTWEALAVVIGALVGGGGIFGVNKLVQKKRNGNGFVTAAECVDRKAVVNKNLDRLNESINRVDGKVDGIKDILIKGTTGR